MADLTCPACGSPRGELIVELPPLPVHVGLLWPTPDAARGCPKGRFSLAVCHECAYVWNTDFQVDELHYEQDYDNALHHSPKFAAWEQDLAAGLVERHDLHGRRIAEIGCGDGRFLALLSSLGQNTGVGFEPGHNEARQSELAAGADVEIHAEFADADRLREVGADLVVARHVLEHVPTPADFLESIRAGVGPDAGVYVEVPNFAWALERGAFEDLMYEHCGYYTPATLAHLLSRTGFGQVEASGTFDDLFAAATASADGSPSTAAIDPSIVEEIRRGAADLRQRISRLEDELAERRGAGQRLAAWGGGARAVGLMNLVTTSDAISKVVDVNPRKQGTFVTGSGHPIVAPENLQDDPPDTILVVNPVYRNEIADMLQRLGVESELIIT